MGVALIELDNNKRHVTLFGANAKVFPVVASLHPNRKHVCVGPLSFAQL